VGIFCKPFGINANLYYLDDIFALPPLSKCSRTLKPDERRG
jgi:hypothetical protein